MDRNLKIVAKVCTSSLNLENPIETTFVAFLLDKTWILFFDEKLFIALQNIRMAAYIPTSFALRKILRMEKEQTNKQTKKHTNKHTYKHTVKHTDKQINRQINKHKTAK